MRDKSIVAIGECGLDRDRTSFAPFDTQLQVWKSHFTLCDETGLPMFIHSRSCGKDTIEILKNYPLKAGGVVHSFDGSLEEAIQICDLPGMFVGINGCSLKTQENLQVVKELPLQNILVESKFIRISLSR